MLSERSQVQMTTYFMIPFIRTARIDKAIERESSGARGGECLWKQGVTVTEYGVSFGNDENVLELVVMDAELYEYTEN